MSVEKALSDGILTPRFRYKVPNRSNWPVRKEPWSDSEDEDYPNTDDPEEAYMLPHEDIGFSPSSDSESGDEDENKDESRREWQERRNKKHRDRARKETFTTSQIVARLQSHYTFVEPLSHRSPRLWVVRDNEHDVLCVLKICDYRSTWRQTPKEVRCLQVLKGMPGVPPLLRWHKFPNGFYAYTTPLVTELDWSEVFEDDENIRSYMFQVLTILEGCRKRGVFHRDVKPGNILWDGTNAMLFDFDTSTFQPDKIRTARIGTEGFRSHEMEKHMGYTWKNDVYSCGVTFGMLLYRLESEHDVDPKVIETWRPITGGKKARRKKQNSKDACSSPFYGSALARDLLLQMIEKDPEKRPTYQQCLSHPYFTQK